MRFSDVLGLAPEFAAYADSMPEALDGRFQVETYGPGEFIHRKDTELERIGILLRGSFRVINEFENGNVLMIERNDAISFIGEVTLLAGADTTSVTIESITDCVVAYLPVADFDAWLRQDIRLLRAVSEQVAAKLYCSSYHRGERLFYSARYVLMKYIVRQAEELEIQNRESVLLPKTRQQMSEEVGMTVKTINRTLTRFAADGLIRVERGKLLLTAAQFENARQELEIYRNENRNGAR